VANNLRFMRTIFLACCGATALIQYSLFTSQSSQGVLLGRWSPAVSGMILFFLLALLLEIAAVLSRSFLKRTADLFQKVPDMAGALMVVFLPALLFVIWFLYPIPLFSRASFTAGSFLLSFAPGLLLISGQEGKRLRRTLAGTAVVAVSFIMTLAAAEVVFRILMPRSIFNPRFGLRPHQRLELQVNLPGITPGGMLTTNMWGFRGEEPPEEWDDYLTIVTIGGSTTANYYLDDSLTWSNVLQQGLREIDPRVWVGNAGIPRHSAETHALFVREVLSSIRPDVALFLVGANDMGPFRSRQVNEERLPDSGIRTWLFGRSMTLQLLYKIKKAYIDGAPVITGTVDPYFVEEPLTVREPPFPDDLHDILADPDFYRERIRTLIHECRSLGILPVFMTQPRLYDDTEYWRGILACQIWTGGQNVEVSAATNWRMQQTLNSDLLEVCRQEDVGAFDLAGEIPHSRDYFYDSMHMTEKGAELVGTRACEYLSEYLAGRGML
jgi:lysophospholipase L1-like esterase